MHPCPRVCFLMRAHSRCTGQVAGTLVLADGLCAGPSRGSSSAVVSTPVMGGELCYSRAKLSLT